MSFLLLMTLAHAGWGDIALIDGNGYNYRFNDDISTTYTSSASGVASEASATTAVAASTVSGGTTDQQLSDAFDGYGGLMVEIGSGETASSALYTTTARPPPSATTASIASATR